MRPEGSHRWITEDEYNKFYTRFREKINGIDSKLTSLQKAEDEYYITANYLLELADRAYELFKSSEAEEKRQLLKLVLQNCKLKGKKLQYTLKKPFDSILFHSSRSAWLPLKDLFINQKVEFDLSINDLKNLTSQS